MWQEVEQAMNDLQKCLKEFKDYNKIYAIKEKNIRFIKTPQ